MQGGGSHGAFTWGVLDRLLEDGRLAIEGISGASAGAMNAVVLAHGFTVGGRDGARQALKDFWESVATNTPHGGMAENGSAPLGDGSSGGSAAALKAFLFMTRFFSPYQLNPFDMNPLRDILIRQIDFDRLRAKQEAGRGLFALGREERRLRRFNTHLIDSPDFMARLSTLSKGNTDAAFIAALRDEGRQRAGTWLENNFQHLGARSSCRFDDLIR